MGLFLLWDGLTLSAALALNLVLRRAGLPALLETWSAIGFLAGLVGMMGFLGGASGAYTGQRWFAETVTRESSMERFRRWHQERERSIDQTTLLLAFGVQVMILAGLGSYLLGRT